MPQEWLKEAKIVPTIIAHSNYSALKDNCVVAVCVADILKQWSQIFLCSKQTRALFA